MISSVSYATELIANASLISSLSITGILAAANFGHFQAPDDPWRVKLTFPALIVISVVIVNILVFSGLGAQVTMNQVVYLELIYIWILGSTTKLLYLDKGYCKYWELSWSRVVEIAIIR